MSVLGTPSCFVRLLSVTTGLLVAIFPVRAADVFANLPGAWSGGGTAVLQDNSVERLRCRAKYSVTPSGTAVHDELYCASDSYKIEMKSDIIYQNGELAGTWFETVRQANGSIRGRVEGDVIKTQVSGLGFHADVGITTRGNKQTITIASEGSYAKTVSIELHSN